ncbi:MAG TPA: hypothetical protein VF458_18215 [Ktedonobacteraceae bacterium]
MYNPYGPQGNNQPPSSPPGPAYGPLQGQQYPSGPINPYYPYPGGPAQPYVPASPPKKKRGKAILIVLPILLVICSVSGWACANSDFTLFDGGLRITGFLAESRVQATATYSASHYPFGTNILFEDNLSTLSGKWKTSPNCTNQGGALHVSVAKAQDFYPCLSTYTPFFDSHGKYTYEVSIKQMDASAAGLIFGGNPEKQYYHFFVISSNGTYALSVYDTLNNGQPYQVIKSGKLTAPISFPLRIGVVLLDTPSIGLYVNGVELTSVNDDSAPSSGYLGVAVFNNQRIKPAWADFGNATCWAHQSDT